METSIGLRPGTVTVLAYHPEWVAAFQAERHRLLSLLSWLVVEIEHVGSTAVPGLSSKPVIDMLVGLRSFELVDEAVGVLVSGGYADRGREAAGRHLVVKGSDERRTHYLHIVAHRSGEWVELLLFGDFLREHLDRAHKYDDLKQALGAKYPTDRDAYAAGKAPFITETLALALQATKDNHAR